MRAGCILAKSGSEYGQVARSCENGNEPSNSVKWEHRDNRQTVSFSVTNILIGVGFLMGHKIAQQEWALRCGSDGPSFKSAQEQKIFLFSKMSRKGLGPTKPPIQREWLSFSGCK
jgi:hypothetical protein